MEIRGLTGIRNPRAVGHHRISRLHEEERRLAGRVCAHLAGVLGIVAAHAVDAAHRKELRTPGHGNAGLGGRRQDVDAGLGHGFRSSGLGFRGRDSGFGIRRSKSRATPLSPSWEAEKSACRLPVAADVLRSPSEATAGRGRGRGWRKVRPLSPTPLPRGERGSTPGIDGLASTRSDRAPPDGITRSIAASGSLTPLRKGAARV
jgi:hypothetical protein